MLIKYYILFMIVYTLNNWANGTKNSDTKSHSGAKEVDIKTFMKIMKLPTLSEAFGFTEDDIKSRRARRQFDRPREYFVDLKTVKKEDLQKKITELEDMFKPKTNLTIGRRYVPPVWTKTWEWWAAIVYATAEQMLRNMLTFIFLARKAIIEIESQKLYDPKDLTFRVGYIYLKLMKARRLLKELFSLVTDKNYNTYRYVYFSKTQVPTSTGISSGAAWWNLGIPTQVPGFNYPTFLPDHGLHYLKRWMWNPIDYLRFYVQAIRHHSEFEYLFRIMVRLHERYCNKTHIYMTKPTSPPPGWWERWFG